MLAKEGLKNYLTISRESDNFVALMGEIKHKNLWHWQRFESQPDDWEHWALVTFAIKLTV